MDSLSRDLVKSFAEVVNEPKQKEPVRYVRGTITGKGDAKYVQLDGSTVATPISEVVDAQEGDRVLVSIENHRAVIVGNFTFSPSARQEQEALEKAEGAENTANSAGETANAAQLAAQEASKNANEAMGAASAASSSAAEAKDQAADAMVAAGNAQASANEAKESAIQANENATQAKTDAANAQAAVANANEEIGKINDAIETAQGEIDQALDDLHSQADEINVIKRDYSTKVETENVKAELSTQITESVGQLQTTIQENYYTKNDIVEIQGNLQSQITQNAEGLSSQATKIESLESDTAEAQEQVDQALEKANAAQQAATQAQQDAATANEAAEKAQNEAFTAAEKAQNANDAALDAKLAAHVADKALADAREALDQARENYKNVVSNPGSTAEDIASAAAQVETARQAVETALEDAAEAQYVANQAQEAADAAQEEANAASQAAQTAQNKADAAEQAANNAQAAAEQAAEDVAALTKRVTTAETKIDQNAEQISLNATKTEEIGDKLVNDYYSKTETDALIKVESDRITSTVSKVETVEKTAITSTIEEFYLSSSPTSLSGGSWVTTQPTWTQGKYIWRRMKVTKGDGTTSYSPSQNGVCITGNTGAKGDTGAQGIQGLPGEDGKSFYTWVKYADTPTSGMSDSPTGKEYIGLAYNKSTATESTNYSDYSWSKIVGEQGPEGPSGEDGQTLYTWIKYADSATGSGMSDSPTGKEYIGIAYNKTTSTESNTASDYSWSLIKGADGASGKDGVSIQSIQEKYAVSSSNSTPPTGWSDEVPNMTPTNKYLWNYEIITYSDKRTETTSKRVIGAYGNTGPQGPAGADGADGKPGATGSPGADGVGIKTITNYYLVSSQNTGITVNTSGWTTTPPTTTTTNKYLWNYEAITYTNGNVVKGTPRIIGTHGATGPQGPNGANGISISKTEVFYYLSTSSTTQTGGSWVTTPPAWVSGKYYWQKIKTTFSNGSSSESTPVCITGAKGQNGSTGAAGQSVTSVTAEYYLSTSKTTQTGGSWVTTMPAWSSGKYLWIRNKIVYANPAKTEYTTPYCDSSWEAVNEIEVGGKNLLQESGNFSKLNLWKTNGGISITVSNEDNYNCIHAVGSISQSSSIYKLEWKTKYVYHSICKFARSGILNTSLPMHYWIYKSNNLNSISASNSAISKISTVAIDLKTGKIVSSIVAGNWYHIMTAFETIDKPSDYLYVLFRPFFYGGSVNSTTEGNGEYWVRWIKLEKGNKATDWTPAPEDIENDISQIETRITSAEQKITDDAIVSTVRKSTLYKNDLNGKVNSTEIISTINQTAEAIKIQASKIKLEGLVTANSYFKILTNGSIEAVNGKFTGTITATSGTIGGWTIQKDSLTCVSHNDGFNVTYTTYIDANNGLIKFLSTSNDYETIISINGMEMHAGRQDGDRWIYDDIYYGVNGISKSGNMTGQTFSLDANGVSFGLTHNLVRWSNGGGFIATNNEVSISNNCRASSFYSSNWFRSTGQTGWYSETYGGGIWMTDSSWVRVYNSKAFLCDNSIRAGGGNQNTLITSNWIGFYRTSDGGRVGWMGANGTNDLYISPEKGTCYIGSNLYVASDASRGGYYLQINSGGGTYAGNGYIFVNSSNGYLALGQGDAYVGSSGGRLYLKPQNQVTYDMFVEPRANRKTTLGSSGKRFYRLYTGLAVDVSSDRRIKEDFTTFDDRYLRLFELLQPTIYKLKYLPEDKSKIGGFIAQDVEEAMKQCGIDKREFGIYKYDSENDEYSLIYDMFIPLTVHYVQEQSKLVNHLKNEVALLKSKINI